MEHTVKVRLVTPPVPLDSEGSTSYTDFVESMAYTGLISSLRSESVTAAVYACPLPDWRACMKTLGLRELNSILASDLERGLRRLGGLT